MQVSRVQRRKYRGKNQFVQERLAGFAADVEEGCHFRRNESVDPPGPKEPLRLFNCALLAPRHDPRQAVRARVARRHIGMPSVPPCP